MCFYFTPKNVIVWLKHYFVTSVWIYVAADKSETNCFYYSILRLLILNHMNLTECAHVVCTHPCLTIPKEPFRDYHVAHTHRL